MINYKVKYFKYKAKYLNLSGGNGPACDLIKKFTESETDLDKLAQLSTDLMKKDDPDLRMTFEER